jgi:hypothetical protein
MRRPFLPLLALLALLIAAFGAQSASAKSSITVGIGDQSGAMFSQPAYTKLGLKKTRYFVRWDVMSPGNSVALGQATDFVNRAKADGVKVLLHLSTNNFTAKKAKLPTVAAYTSAVKKIVPYFRKLGVTDFGAWNEENNATQPTYNNPKRAGQFFTAMYGVVKKSCASCNVVALDVLDQSGVQKYITRFYSSLSKTSRSRAKLVGIHNYGDVNRVRKPLTASMISTTHKYNKTAKFWFTETGGLVSFGPSFTCSESRAALKLKQVFKIATKYKSQGVQRIYLYNWFGTTSATGSTDCNPAFDAGLVNADGSTRPGYTTLLTELPLFSK